MWRQETIDDGPTNLQGMNLGHHDIMEQRRQRHAKAIR
jgi:hypothetical protein